MLYIHIEIVDGKERCERIRLNEAQDLLYCRLLDLNGNPTSDKELDRIYNQSIEELGDSDNVGMVWSLGDSGRLLMVAV